MADSPEPPSRRLHTVSNTSHLQYPTFPPLSGSVEEWLSHSRPISMTSTPSTEHLPKSLSESWATLSASDVHSEDGTHSEQTDVGSLIDQAGPDDVASLDGRYSSNDELDGNDDEGLDNESYDSRSEISGSQELHPVFPPLGCCIDDSNLTTQTAFRQSTESIEFVEPDKWPEVERVELKHTIRLFEASEIAELGNDFSHYLQDSTLMATVQQTMTKESIDTDKPFRVLYVGSSEFRSIILDKLGDVLVSSTTSGFESSSTESSRYHVVPTSFGPGAVPNFAELLPIHVQLIVDECPSASSEPHVDKPSTINLNFKNRPSCTSYWTGTEYCISSATEWVLPDVAIIFLSSLDTAAAVKTQNFARTFLERHGVPTMAISEKSLWKMNREFVPLNPHSLHTCLESRHAFTGKTTVLRRYPIDLHTFESITPGQLNRNLASLARIYPKKPCKIISEIPHTPRGQPSDYFRGFKSKNFPLTYLENDLNLAPVLRLIKLAVISAVAFAGGYLALNASAVFFSNVFSWSAMSNLTTTALNSQSTGISPLQGLKQSSISTLPSSANDVQLLGSEPGSQFSIGHLINGAPASIETLKTPDSFDIQVVGDCHLIIKPPNKLSNSKRLPQFNVQVNRQGNILHHELSRLFEGVYTLKLDRGEAYGLVNVTITTNSKPSVKQSTVVDLGTPWLKIASWKRAAHTITSQFLRDLATVQTGLSEAYDRICTDLQVLMGDVVKRAHILRWEAESINRDSVHLPPGAREAVLSTSKQLSEVFRRTAVQPFLSASSIIHGQTNKANREARQMVSGTWSKISACAPTLDFHNLLEHIRNARKCKTLDKAQKSAKGLMRGKTS